MVTSEIDTIYTDFIFKFSKEKLNPYSFKISDKYSSEYNKITYYNYFSLLKM